MPLEATLPRLVKLCGKNIHVRSGYVHCREELDESVPDAGWNRATSNKVYTLVTCFKLLAKLGERNHGEALSGSPCRLKTSQFVGTVRRMHRTTEKICPVNRSYRVKKVWRLPLSSRTRHRIKDRGTHLGTYSHVTEIDSTVTCSLEKAYLRTMEA